MSVTDQETKQACLGDGTRRHEIVNNFKFHEYSTSCSDMSQTTVGTVIFYADMLSSSTASVQSFTPAESDILPKVCFPHRQNYVI